MRFHLRKRQERYYPVIMPQQPRQNLHLLPEEDVLDDPDEDDDADPTLPGDLWFRDRLSAFG
jgi:hypothetical protein